MPRLFSIVRDLSGAPVPNARLAFRAMSSRPGAIAGDVRGTTDLQVTADAFGYWLKDVEPGEYYVWIGASRRRAIFVPETPDYIILGDLFTGQDSGIPRAGQNYRLSNAERQLVNASSGAFQSFFIDDVGGLKELAFAAPGEGTTTANFRYRSGMLEIFCADTNTWHAPYLEAGELNFAADGATPIAVDRILSGRWQLKDITTGKFRTWFIIGAIEDETTAFGPEES